MKDRRTELAATEFDILIIGAGMFGACIAWSAVLRGYSVAVIDKNDFANATSSNHYKFIHGGIRYLQHLDLLRVRESSRERSALIRIAPHLAYPMPVVFPTYGHGRRGKALMRAAMLAYDILTLDRNRGIEDSTRRTPNGTVLDREPVLEMFPGLPQDKLTGAAVFHDGQIYNSARLVLAFLRSAEMKGAIAANYVKADQLVREKNKIVGCDATDALSGNRFQIRAKMVINAAGPWGHLLMEDDSSLALRPRPNFSRDLAFVIKRPVCRTHAIGCQSGSTDSDAILDRGGRHLFLVPWRGMTLVGVWHRYSLAHPDNIAVSREELQEYVSEINDAYDGLDLSTNDIAMINTGHILFGPESAQGSEKQHSFAKRSLIFDHAKDGIDGLVTVVGARATVARGVAEKMMTLVQHKLDDRVVRSKTDKEPVHGGHFNDFGTLVSEIRKQLPVGGDDAAIAIAHNYGSEYKEVLECASDAALRKPIGSTSVIGAEIVHAIRYEMAKSLADIVFRRTELGSGGDPGSDVIDEVARLAKAEFGWNSEETTRQVQSVQRILRSSGPWNIVDRLGLDEANTA